MVVLGLRCRVRVGIVCFEKLFNVPTVKIRGFSAISPDGQADRRTDGLTD